MQYTAALCRFLQQTETNLPVDTVYFGGRYAFLVAVAASRTDFTDHHKTVFDPAAGNHTGMQSGNCHKGNAFRLSADGHQSASIGVQSLSDVQLKRLGRLHSAEEAIATVEQAAAVGFENLSCDVMLALPQQTGGELQSTLEQLTALPIQHVPLIC